MTAERGFVSLVRHGQASFGQENYDQLSPLGGEQLEHVGRHLAQREEPIDLIIRGDLVRHEQSVEALLRGYGARPEVAVLADWNEFDHRAVIRAYAKDQADLRAWFANPKPLNTQSTAEKQKIMQIFREAVVRWQLGQHDLDYQETWSAFGARVTNAWQSTQKQLQGRQNILVLTSGGPIALSVMASLAMPHEAMLTLNQRLVNGGMTRFLTAAEGEPQPELLSLNEQQHFLGKYRHLLTYI